MSLKPLCECNQGRLPCTCKAAPKMRDWLLVTHPDGHDWVVRTGSKEHDRAVRTGHLRIAALLPETLPVTTTQAAMVADQWPKLEKPAMVGAGRFSAGVSSRLVVEAAQRHYGYEVTPEKETLRIAQGATSLLQRWRHAALPPSAAVLCLMAIAAKNACGEDAAGIPLFVFAAAIKAALAEQHSDHARALDAAMSLDDGGP